MKNQALWLTMVFLVALVGWAPSRAQDVTNLLPNGGFESGVIAPYATYGTCTTEVVTTCVGAAVPEGPAEGKYCLHIVVPVAGVSFWDVYMADNNYAFRKGKMYRLSCFMKTKSGTLQINMKPEHAAPNWEGYGEVIVTVGNRWQEFTTATPVFTADVSPASPTFHMAFAPGDFWMDDIRLYEIDPTTKYSGGTGTAEDPYKIATAADLNRIGTRAEDWASHFILVNDIDLSAYKDTQFNRIGGWYEDPAPNDKPFTGVFDGQGHRIRNFTWTSVGKNGIGLFRTVKFAQIRNVGIENVKIRTNGGQTVAALVALSIESTVSACYSTGSILALEKVGGLVGQTQDSTMINCWSSVDIADSRWWAGGLVGWSSGPVRYCYSTGRVAGESGGLSGGGSDVVNCYWDVDTSVRWDSAGGIGKTTAQMMKANTYYGWEGCNNEGVWTINEGKDYPHLAWEGKPGGSLPRRQLSDSVPGSGSKTDPYRISTAEQLNLIGLFPCEWDKYFVMANDIDLGKFKDTQFNMIGGYDFTGVFDGNGHVIRNFSARWPLASRVGLFTTLAGQVKNLGLENVSISNVSSWSHAGGLVAVNANGAISNCYVAGKLAMGAGGGLVGYNSGRIDSCCAAVEIATATWAPGVGGLVGDQENGRISNSYSTGKISAGRFVGGLVGSARGSAMIENCYSLCSVGDVGEMGGGLVGVAGWTQGDSVLIVNCYSTGSVRASGNATIGGLVGVSQYGSTILGCFWDTKTSGLSKSAAGMGKTTTDLQTLKTFLDAGWDFVGETANGTEDLWKMPEFKSYPLLAWQAAAPPPPGPLVEGFESGLGNLNWTFDGSPRWMVVSSASHSGMYSARAGAIGDDESTSLSIKLDCTAENIAFWLKTSCEPYCDFLTFSIDGKEKGRWAGELDWRQVSFPVAAGLRTFTWTYSKDNSSSRGQDTAWIDDIVFPAPSNR